MITHHISLEGLVRKKGWRLRFTQSEVLIIRPNKEGDTSYADDFVEELDDQDVEFMELEEDEELEVTFGLEADLQSALRANIGQLEEGLSIADSGVERTTEAGRMDILALDEDSKYVVIELKAGRAQSKSVAQILAYMTAIAEEMGTNVRGMIVAGSFSERVLLAARAVPNLDLVTYSFNFAFSKAA